MAEYDKKNKPEIRIDERKAMREQWLKESDAVHDSAMRYYRDTYWADAILLRNELYRRLQRLQKAESDKFGADISKSYQRSRYTSYCRSPGANF